MIRCTADSALSTDAAAAAVAAGRRRMQGGAGAATEVADMTIATIVATGADSSAGTLAALAFTPAMPE